MKADELAAPTGDSFKFGQVGDTIEGVITFVGDWQEQTNKFNDRKEQVARIGIDNGGGTPTYIWPRKGSAMASALADALRDAGLGELAEGQTLKLRFDSTKDTGKGQPLKLFKARVTPGEPVAKPDEEPF